MDWIDVAQDSDHLWTLVNTVMNHNVLGVYGIAEKLLASQLGLGSMKLVGCLLILKIE